MGLYRCRIYIHYTKYSSVAVPVLFLPDPVLKKEPNPANKLKKPGSATLAQQFVKKLHSLLQVQSPVLRIRIRIRSDSVFLGHPDPFIHKQTPCYSNFLVIKLSKIQFRPNIFFLILSVIGCLDLVRKCHKKVFILLNIKNISKY